MPVPALSTLAVSLFVPEHVAPAAYHQYSQQTTYLADGDHAGDTGDGPFAKTVSTWLLLDAVRVRARTRGTVLALGDSITEVQESRTPTPAGRTSWPAASPTATARPPPPS